MTAARREAVLPPGKAPFVNRTAELGWLAERFSEARTGEPSIAVVTGEAGVGKSRLLREALRRAEETGLQTCYGRFVEGSSMPFLPFVSAFIPHLRRAGALLPEGADLASLQHLSGAPGAPAGGAMPMLVELGHRMLALAERRPMVLVFDDVQWATAAELEALEHLGHALVDAGRGGVAPVSLVLVSRPLEPEAPANKTFTRLRREPITSTLGLQGFTEPESAAFIRNAVNTPCSRRLSAVLQRATRGNPLFLGEALVTLSERNELVVERGVVETLAEPEELVLPQEVTEAIAARASTLDPETTRLLSIAALIGGEFGSRELAIVGKTDESAVLDSLERAVEGRFLAESGELFQFAHPIARHVFAVRGTAARRRLTHLEIANYLAAEPAVSRAAIAFHLVAAGQAADAQVTARAAHEAAREALSMHDWADAGRYFEVALGCGPYLAGLVPEERAQLTYEAAFAHYRNMDVPLSRERFGDAIAQARDMGDVEAWSLALVGAIRAEVAHGGVQPARLLDSSLFDDFVARSAGFPLARARVEVEWAEALFAARDPAALSLATEALAVGRESNDDLLCAHALVARGLALLQALLLDEALNEFEASLAHAVKLADPWYQGWALQNLPGCLLMLGRLAEADAACRRALEHGNRTHDWAVAATALGYRTVVAVLRGEHDLAEELASECSGMVARSDYSWAAPPMLAALGWSRGLRGDWAGAEDVGAAFQAAVGKFNAWTPTRLLRAMQQPGSLDSEQLASEGRYAFWTSKADSFTAGLFGARIELARYSGLRELAQAAGDALSAAPEELRFSVFPPFSVRRSIGLAHLLGGDAQSAESELRLALREVETSGSRTEFAIACGDLAEACMANGLEAEALRLLEQGYSEANLLGLASLVERYRTTAQTLGAPFAPPSRGVSYPDGLSEIELDVLCESAKGLDVRAVATALLLSDRTVTAHLASAARKTGVVGPHAVNAYLHAQGLIAERLPGSEAVATEARAAGLQVLMFNDIVGSTPLNRALGDERYVALLSRHDAIVERAVQRQRGRVIKNTGDGVFAAFPSARGAVQAALQLQSTFPIALDSHPAEMMRVRIGLHAGEPLAKSEDLFGLSVTLARRICDRAGEGELLVSDSVRDLCEGGEFGFRERGRFWLKGIGRRVRLFEVYVVNSV